MTAVAFSLVLYSSSLTILSVGSPTSISFLHDSNAQPNKQYINSIRIIWSLELILNARFKYTQGRQNSPAKRFGIQRLIVSKSEQINDIVVKPAFFKLPGHRHI